MTTTASIASAAAPDASSWRTRQVTTIVSWFERIPNSLISLIARFSIAAVFWNSGQTKVEGLAINIVTGEFKLGWPRLSDSVLELFKDEYRLPLLPPEFAAPMTATAEHLFPLLILIGLATRLSALALLCMTVVIQVFAYSGAYATHGTWMAVLLFLVARGPGVWSVDHWLWRRHGGTR